VPCRLFEVNRRFKGLYCLHHQGDVYPWLKRHRMYVVTGHKQYTGIQRHHGVYYNLHLCYIVLCLRYWTTSCCLPLSFLSTHAALWHRTAICDANL
jgi:hypothetical protein